MNKFVLHGFYNTEEAEVKENISMTGITPVKVKKMNIKKKKFQDHCTYIVYFTKNDNIKIAKLFGHGGLNCGLNPRCIR